MPSVILTDEHERLELHFNLLVRQMAGISKCLLKIYRLHKRTQGDEYEQKLNGYKGFTQTELADAIQHCRIIGDILGLSFEETVRLGEERYLEKKKEFQRRYPKEIWI